MRKFVFGEFDHETATFCQSVLDQTGMPQHLTAQLIASHYASYFTIQGNSSTATFELGVFPGDPIG